MTATDLNGVVRVLESLEWFPEASRPTGVLIVSKNLDARLTLSNHLENRGYGIWTAGTSTDAYQIGIEHPVAIDMLLCDESLTDIPVLELYSRLKVRIPSLRCCVMSATMDQAFAKEAARLGAVVLALEGNGTSTAEEHELALAAGSW